MERTFSLIRQSGDVAARGRLVRRRPRRLFVLWVLLLLLLPPAGAWGAQPPAPKVAAAAIALNAVSLPGVRPGGLFQTGHIEVPYHTLLNPSGGSITIEAWVKRDAYDRNETLVGNGRDASYWLGFSASGELSFTPHGRDGIVDGNGTVASGVWTHVAVTYDGTTRRYFINGVLDLVSTEHPGPLVPAASEQPLGIGFDRDDSIMPNYFGGRIDNLRIWNVARSANFVAAGKFWTYGGP